MLKTVGEQYPINRLGMCEIRYFRFGFRSGFELFQVWSEFQFRRYETSTIDMGSATSIALMFSLLNCNLSFGTSIQHKTRFNKIMQK